MCTGKKNGCCGQKAKKCGCDKQERKNDHHDNDCGKKYDYCDNRSTCGNKYNRCGNKYDRCNTRPSCGKKYNDCGKKYNDCGKKYNNHRDNDHHDNDRHDNHYGKKYNDHYDNLGCNYGNEVYKCRSNENCANNPCVIDSSKQSYIAKYGLQCVC